MARGSTGRYEPVMESINNSWIAFGQPGTQSVIATQPLAEFFAKLAKQQRFFQRPMPAY